MRIDSSTTALHACARVSLFTGKERDTESGLDYFGARYYASNMGRWMSPDWSARVEPVPYSEISEPQTLNLYSYVLNNPLTSVDPDGHFLDHGTGGSESSVNQPIFNTQVGIASWAIQNGGTLADAAEELGRFQAQQQSGSTERITVTLLGAVQIPEQVVEKTGDIAEEGLEKVESNPAVASKIEELTEEANGLYPKLEKKVDQLHHVIPKYLGGAKDQVLIRLPAAYHQLITNAFRTRLPYGVQHSADAVEKAIQEVYKMFPLP